MAFAEAVEEVWYSHKTQVAETTLRRVTYENGRAAEAVSRQEAEVLYREAPEAEVRPERVLVSVDGAFIHLTSGDWREVKTVAIGEFEPVWDKKTWERQVKAKNISYFSRSYRAREFEYYALSELHQRGVFQAQQVVSVNDGAAVNQSFLDYHLPNAIRIIDFWHTTGYLGDAGKAVWGEESESFTQWMDRACHTLKHRPPRETVANLRLLLPKAETEEQEAKVDSAIFYIQTRLQMMDYPHFRMRGYPIGSGNVESGHKVVVQRRMKGAGMRWAAGNVDPMLALRSAVCNRRWEAVWEQAVLFRQEQQVLKQLSRSAARKSPPSAPITFASLKAAGLLPEDEQPPSTSPAHGPWRPGEDHPWRNNKWPTKEAWRWN
jgi:hypothetical protein